MKVADKLILTLKTSDGLARCLEERGEKKLNRYLNKQKKILFHNELGPTTLKKTKGRAGELKKTKGSRRKIAKKTEENESNNK